MGDRDFLGSVDSLQRFPKAALPGQLSDYFPQSLVLCRVQPQDRRYPWNLGRFPLHTRFTGEGDDDESLPTSSPELTMIHDMLKSAHTQLITIRLHFTWGLRRGFVTPDVFR